MVSSSVSSSVGTASPFCSLFFTVMVRSEERSVIGVIMINHQLINYIIIRSATDVLFVYSQTLDTRVISPHSP